MCMDMYECVGCFSFFFPSIESLHLKCGARIKKKSNAHLNAVYLYGPLPVADLELGSPPSA